MDAESPHATPYQRRALASSRQSAGEEETASIAGKGKPHNDEDPLVFLSKPTGWVVSAITTQAELISAAVLSVCSPILSLFLHARAVPRRVARSAATVLRGLTFGLLGAAYAVSSLIVVMALAFLLGVFLVRLWVEEPILLRRPLYFDYTQPQPDAVTILGGVGTRGREVPVGHKVSVALKLVMPESDFNRRVGIFQVVYSRKRRAHHNTDLYTEVSAEVISSNGRIIAASSRPCMLRFSSLPIRLMKIFAMAFPVLMGVHTETQQMELEILRYNEGTHKTESIKLRLTPRTGTYDLPQIYDAEILLHTRLPRWKEAVYNWKWTLYVWVSLNIYVLLLILLLCLFKPFEHWRRRRDNPVRLTKADPVQSHVSAGDIKNSQFVVSFRRWRERRGSTLMAQNQVAHSSPEFVQDSDSSDVGEAKEFIDESASFVTSESSVCVDL